MKKFNFNLRFLDKVCFLVSIAVCSFCLSTIGWAVVNSSHNNVVSELNDGSIVCSDSVSIVK